MITRFLGRAYGPASVSVAAMALVAPLGIILGALSGPRVDEMTPSIWIWALVDQVIFTALALGLPWIFRARHPLARAACVAFAGAVRGLAISQGFVALGLSDPTLGEVLWRSLHSAVACTLWIGFCGVLLQGGKDFRTSYRILMTERVGMQRASGIGVPPADAPPADVQERWQELSHSLDGTVAQAREILAAPITSADDLRAAADVIGASVKGEMREASHGMWRTATMQPPRLRWRELLGAILTPWDPPVVLIMAVYGSLNAMGSISRSGVVVGLLTATILTAEIGLLLALSRVIARRLPRHQSLVGVATMLLMPAVLLVVTTAMIQGLHVNAVDHMGAIVVVVSASLCCWTVMIYQRLSNEREILLAELRTRLADEMVQAFEQESRAKILTADLGTFVHHSLSSQMTALDLHLRQAAECDDPVVHDRARVTARQRLTGLQALTPPWDNKVSGRDHIARVARSWEGIAEVTVDLAPEHQGGEQQWTLAALVVEESVAGAIRSGGATRLTVTGRMRGSELHLSIEDDGSGMPADTTPGMGTHWLEWNFAGAWSRSNLIGGSRMDVCIT